MCVYSFLASGNFCHLLITFANSLDPDQARQNFVPDRDPNCLTLVIFPKEINKKVDQQMTKKYANLPSRQRFKMFLY